MISLPRWHIIYRNLKHRFVYKRQQLQFRYGLKTHMTQKLLPTTQKLHKVHIFSDLLANFAANLKFDCGNDIKTVTPPRGVTGPKS